MNFFGHAAVASWSVSVSVSGPVSGPAPGPAPGVVLGAMLPDFATMCRGKIPETDDASVNRGIALHHATDAVFHQLAVVTGLMRELDADLDRRGCARGPRRAVAHIGVELLLDGVLVGEPEYCAAYLRGLAHDPPLAWRDPDTAARFAGLLERLRAHGVPADLGRPDAITTRVHRILAHRPLLAPSPADLRAIGGALAAFKPRIDVASEAIVRGVRAALETSS